jgi:drug/metabolite transporter (DMT)-like permease
MTPGSRFIPILSAKVSRVPLLGLWFGVCAVSAAPILIKLTLAPALAIAAYRLGFAIVILYPAFYARRLRAQVPYTPSDFALSIFAGLLLALHFATWISSLSFTSVASSIVLVSTTPIFAALIAHFFTRDKVSVHLWLAVALTFIGSIIITWEDFFRGKTAFWGDLLALAGAITGAGYLLIGRRARRSRDLLSYIFPLYFTAGSFLFLTCLLTKTPLNGYPSSAWLYLLLLALVPTVLGHSSINWSLKYFHPAVVGVFLLAEPVISIILAYFILSEAPTAVKLLGCAVVISGIALGFINQTGPPTLEGLKG